MAVRVNRSHRSTKRHIIRLRTTAREDYLLRIHPKHSGNLSARVFNGLTRLSSHAMQA